MDSAKAMPIFPEDLRDVCGHTASPALSPQELWLFMHAGLARLVNLEESL